VLSAYYVTGETDFMLIVSAKHADSSLYPRFFYNNAGYQRVQTTVVMDRIKRVFSRLRV